MSQGERSPLTAWAAPPSRSSSPAAGQPLGQWPVAGRGRDSGGTCRRPSASACPPTAAPALL